MKTFRNLVCIGAGVLAMVGNVHAAPYASGVTNTGGGVINYYINSALVAGDTVTITSYPSATVVANNPATPAQGTNSFTLAGSDTSYAISVNHVGSGSISPITVASANTVNVTWGSPDPRGLAVNTTPTNGATFGTVYVASSAVGSSGTHGKGLFAFHSDMSVAFGQTSTGSYSTTWTAGGTSGPFKVSVSPYDGSVVANDETAANANAWMCDPYLRTSVTPVQMLAGLGSAAAPLVHGQEYGKSLTTGTLAGGNLVLYTFDITLPSVASNSLGGSMGAIGAFTAGVNYFNSTMEWTAGNPGAQITAPPGSAGGPSYNCLYQYNIGSTIPGGGWNNAPDLCIAEGLNILGLVGDMDVAPDGKKFIVAERTNPGSAPYLTVYDPSGLTNLFCSATSASDDAVQDLIYAAGEPNQDAAPYSVKVSPDDKFVAIYGIDGYIGVLSLTNGVPDLSAFTYVNPGIFADGREIGWDSADNIYGLNSGSGVLYIYDLGLTTTCVTSNDVTGTNGSFQLVTPNLSASVVASTNMAFQANNSYATANSIAPAPAAVPAVFSVSLSAAQSVPVNIAFTLSGTATNGVNYVSSSSNVVNFPIGATNEMVTITPTASPVSGPTLSVIFSLKSGAAYSAVPPSSATAYIANSGPQVITAGTTTYPTMYRGTPFDYVGFQVVRWGDTNIAFSVSSNNFAYTGTAHNGTDYTNPVPTMSFPASTTVVVATNGDPVSSAFPFTYVGNESIIITMSGGTDPNTSVAFTVGPVPSATMTLLDNANPPEAVLWSDPLTSATDTSWNLAFGSDGNGTAASPAITFIPNYNQSTGPDNTDVAHDYEVEFGAILANDPVIAQTPPSGATTALHVTVNKINGITYTVGTNTFTGTAGGVALYPAGPTGIPMHFEGNYALRFSELTYEDTGGSSTEYTQFGIDHYGSNALWWAGSGSGGAGNTNIDGIWYSLTCDQGGASFGDVLEFEPVNNTYPNTGWTLLGDQSWNAFSAVFKHPPYNSSGTGAFSEGFGNPAYLWNDVEIKQSNAVITLSINKSVIFTYTNVSIMTNGDVMLGYSDPFDSIGTLGEAYYSNVRVIELSPLITNAPIAATVGAGTNHTFTVGAVGVGPFTNTWYLGATPVQTDVYSATPNNDVDSLTVVSPTASGTYTVVITDFSGSITSTPVALTVIQDPVITGPTSVTNYYGATVTFTATTVSGTTPFTYSWTSNATTLGNVGNVTGATTATLSLSSIVLADAATYAVKATNFAGVATGSATLTVLASPQPLITNTTKTGNVVKLQFNNGGDAINTTNSFTVQSATNLVVNYVTNGAGIDQGVWTAVSPVPSFAVSSTNFTVTISNATGTTTNKFYRIQHK